MTEFVGGESQRYIGLEELRQALPNMEQALSIAEANMAEARTLIDEPEYRSHNNLASIDNALKRPDIYGSSYYYRWCFAPGAMKAMEQTYLLREASKQWTEDYAKSPNEAVLMRNFEVFMAYRLLFSAATLDLRAAGTYNRATTVSTMTFLHSVRAVLRKFPQSEDELIEAMSNNISALGQLIHEQPESPARPIALRVIESLQTSAIDDTFLPSGHPLQPALQKARYGARSGKMGPLARTVKYDIDEEAQIDDYINTITLDIEKVSATQRRITDAKIQKNAQESVRLILDTLAICETVYGNSNAQKIRQGISGTATQMPNSLAATIPLTSVIKMANALTPMLNQYRDPEVKFQALASSIESLPEAFRRLMLVIFDAEEAENDQTMQLQLDARFASLDLFAQLVQVNNLLSMRKLSKVAMDYRGEIPTQGSIYWRRWQPGYGTIS